VSTSPVPATASAAAVLALGAASFLIHDFGPLSRQMALHIALMNVVAPLAASLPARHPGTGPAASLWLLAALQIVLLWAWHAPPVQRQVVDSAALHAIMHASLFVVAFGFWRALLRLSPAARWQGIAVLLLTGKLTCLLAVLLIFAPRLLYELPVHGHGAGGGAPLPGLEDQQLAGLLMVAACPLSYLVAGLIVAARIIRDLGASPAAARNKPLAAAGS
jgi:putative membrane protein